jgi:hypothetical protein
MPLAHCESAVANTAMEKRLRDWRDGQAQAVLEGR